MANTETTDSFRIWVPELDAGERPDDDLYLRLWFAHSVLIKSLPAAGYHQVGPSFCGWYHLWWRAWDATTSIAGCYEGDARMALEAISRVLSETGLHVSLIGQLPVNEAASSEARGARQLVRRRIVDRLRGYLAWLLHNEVRTIVRLLQPAVLEATFEAETARQHTTSIQALSENTPFITRLFPEVETLTDAEAERERAQYQAALEDNKRDIEWRLHSPDLSDWRRRLEVNPTLGLEQVLDGAEAARSGGVAGGFTRLDLLIAGPHYGRLSARLHGSNWSAALRFADGNVLPNGAFFKDTETLAESAIVAAVWVASQVAHARPDITD